MATGSAQVHPTAGVDAVLTRECGRTTATEAGRGNGPREVKTETGGLSGQKYGQHAENSRIVRGGSSGRYAVGAQLTSFDQACLTLLQWLKLFDCGEVFCD